MAYGKNIYGASEYAEKLKDSILEEYFVDLTEQVPKFIAAYAEMKALYQAQGYEVGYLWYGLTDIISQCFAATATWGISRWEKIFGVETNLQLTYEQRREILFAKLRGQGTTTLEMIKEAAAAFSGGEVEVLEDNVNYRFTIRFIGIKGIPRNMQGFIRMLEEIKPAHLAYRFEYRYTVWNDLDEYHWDEIKYLSWDEIRIMKEDSVCRKQVTTG